MWKDFSVKYILYNKGTSFFVAGITFVAATLLSLLSGVFYNLWMDYVVQQKIQNPDYVPAAESIVIAYSFIMVLAAAALVTMIHNGFEVSMNSRIRQMGILQSIGATQKQVRSILLQEVCILCMIPIAAGVLLGVLFCYNLVQAGILLSNRYEEYKTLHYEVKFYYHFAILVVSLVFSFVTVLISAWIPAFKLSKLSPLESIRYGGELQVNKVKPFFLFSFLFGIYGELACKSMYARRKMLRTTTFTLTVSFLAFISFLNFEKISYGFVQETYFERYQDIWDITVTARDSGNEEELREKIMSLDNIENCMEYKIIKGKTYIPHDWLSEEVTERGLGNLIPDSKPDQNRCYLLPVTIYILDHASFDQYCEAYHLAAGGKPVLLNTVWDSVNSNFNHPIYIPFLKDSGLLSLEVTSAEVPVPVKVDTAASHDLMPDIKEKLSDHSMNLVASENYYDAFLNSFICQEKKYTIRIPSEAKEAEVIADIKSILGEESHYTVTGRITEAERDKAIRTGLNIFIGFMASLLACIGLSNVFSVTLGQLHQRKREFVRYFSLGLSLKGLRKILFLEVLMIAIKPLMLSVLLNVPVVAWALSIAGVSGGAFLEKAPYAPVACFAWMVLSLTGFAYYLTGRKICREDIISNLKDELLPF